MYKAFSQHARFYFPYVRSVIRYLTFYEKKDISIVLQIPFMLIIQLLQEILTTCPLNSTLDILYIRI